MIELRATVPRLRRLYGGFKALHVLAGTPEESVRLTVYEALLTLLKAAENRHPPADYQRCYRSGTALIYTIKFHVQALEDDIREAKRRNVKPAQPATAETFTTAFWLNKVKQLANQVENGLPEEKKAYWRTFRVQLGLAE